MITPFEFAVVAEADAPASAWLAGARRAEDLGYHAFLATDHVADRQAAWPLLGAVAASTEHIKVGTYVLNNDLRHPVVMAKDFAALHSLSGGRGVLGIGAGWQGADYAVTGVRRDRGKIRLARLAESVGIVKALLAGSAVDVDGSYYQVHAAANLIAPADTERPALLIGGARRGTLRLAARDADIVSVVAPLGSQGVASTADLGDMHVDRQIADVREAAVQRLKPPRLNHIVWECLIARRAAVIRDKVARAYRLTPDGVRRSPGLLVGTVDEVVETLLERRERWGFSFVTVPMSALDMFAPVVGKLAGS